MVVVDVAQSSGVLIVGAPCVCGLWINCSIAKACVVSQEQ